MATIRFKRGTRSEIDAAASASDLLAAEPYYITDDEVLAVGKSTTTYLELPTANNYTTNLDFSPSTGILTLDRDGLSSITVDLDGRYLMEDYYLDGAAFTAGTGNLALSRAGLSTLNVDLSTINADQVDGFEASQFLRSDAADTATGQITFDAGLRLPRLQTFDAEYGSGNYGRVVDPRIFGFTFLGVGDIDNQWISCVGYFDSLVLPGGGASVNVIDIHSDGRNVYAQYTSSDTSTNINGTNVPIPFDTEEDEETGYSLDTGTHEVTVSEAGTYRVYAQVCYYSVVQRANVSLAIRKNSTLQNARGYGGYLRSLNGHNEASVVIEEYIQCVANDKIAIIGNEAAAAGTVNLTAGSILIIERKR